jgi:hypothetical protein
VPPDLRHRLGVKATLDVHARQRRSRQAQARRLYAIAPPAQPAYLLLDGRIGGVDLVRALHVPNGTIKVAQVLAHDGHSHIRKEIIRDGGEHALKDIGHRAVPVREGLSAAGS